MGEQRGLAPLLTVDLAPVTVELNLRESGARFPCKWSSVLEIYTAVRQQRCKARKSRTLSDQGQKLQLFSNSRRIRLDLLQSELPIKLSHCKLQLLW